MKEQRQYGYTTINGAVFEASRKLERKSFIAESRIGKLLKKIRRKTRSLGEGDTEGNYNEIRSFDVAVDRKTRRVLKDQLEGIVETRRSEKDRVAVDMIAWKLYSARRNSEKRNYIVKLSEKDLNIMTTHLKHAREGRIRGALVEINNQFGSARGEDAQEYKKLLDKYREKTSGTGW